LIAVGSTHFKKIEEDNNRAFPGLNGSFPDKE
jgi:hypothetical protein